MHPFLAALALFVSSVPVAPTLPSPRDYRVRFFHTHTGERLDIVYRQGNRYVPGALDQLNRYLRDHRTNDVHPYDPQVFDLLHDLLASVGRPDAEIDVICGYRTPKSNAYLRSNPRQSPSTACTCRPLPSTSAFPASPRRNCARPLLAFSAAVSVTTPNRGSFTSM